MISPSMKKILLQRTALHIFWLQFYPLKGSTYDNFCWCEWERVSCVIAAIRQGTTVYLFLGYSKCCPHFFSWQGQMNFQWIPLPWTPFCGISLLITSQHWQSSLSAFLNDLKLSDQIASILPLLDIILAKANRKLSAVMLRVSSRFTARFVQHVPSQLLGIRSWCTKVPENQYCFVNTGDGVIAPLGEVLSFVLEIWSWNSSRYDTDSLLSSPHFFLEWSNTLVLYAWGYWLVTACNYFSWAFWISKAMNLFWWGRMTGYFVSSGRLVLWILPPTLINPVSLSKYGDRLLSLFFFGKTSEPLR